MVAQLRAAGVASVNLDLMYGLPLQTGANVADTWEWFGSNWTQRTP